MCGILGFLGPQGSVQAQAFSAALDELAHRGPDDRGIFSDAEMLLGHQRLSILDLSPAGHQPMIEAGSGAVIVFNGEIYNYLELRKELEALGHRFVSRSDTEVLLHAYLAWGSDCLRRLNGMWAFAIWLPAQRRLFFARDRFGVKPFYYAEHGGFAFASEPKAILKLFPRLRAVDTTTLAQFLTWGHLYASDSSFYRGVKVLPPAHCGEVQVGRNSPRIWKYWDYRDAATAAHDGREAVEQFAELFEDAVRLRHRSDVPVGITLSGGIDSTAVLAASVRTSAKHPVCFTSVYGEHGEGEAAWARQAAALYDIEPIEVPAQKGQWVELLRRIGWHLDGPGYSPAVFPLWAIMQEARRRETPVLLEGQGADEAFGGYAQYAALAILSALKRAARRPTGAVLRELSSAVRGAMASFSPKWTALWVLREAFPGLIQWNRNRASAGSTLCDTLRIASTEADMQNVPGVRYPDPLNERLWRDHSSRILPGLLQYGDAISMAHAIETRLPFMDYRLIEWAFSQPSEIKIGRGVTKRVVREYLAATGQRAIAARMDKQGYPTPAENWLREHNAEIPRTLLLNPASAIREYCDQGRIAGLIRLFESGRPGLGNHLYRLLSTELWLRECVTGQAPAI
ncbi:MAG TPA: asparagine synthase (glutamine-hydrolyzing) [Burkholderiales bacterium]|jgi:asparagine synthase (glutamine-hydrolysing)|nr:asparagine synthase (glutamine-hydrolyzing) [Burkholderiales bacterium]